MLEHLHLSRTLRYFFVVVAVVKEKRIQFRMEKFFIYIYICKSFTLLLLLLLLLGILYGRMIQTKKNWKVLLSRHVLVLYFTTNSFQPSNMYSIGK